MHDINTKHESIKKQPRGTNAVKFLERICQRGPWCLTAIIPDGPTCTETFDDPETARKFIAAQNLDQNLYYTINPTRTAVTKKPSKADILAVEFLHVDADPRPDEQPDKFKDRLLAEVDKFKPLPTAMIDSGNGIQLLWRLDKPIEVTGPDVIADIEARNYALAEAFGADPSTRNIDRLFRLPGTTNFPNAKKHKLGRVECRARLIEWNDVAYPLPEFPTKVLPVEKAEPEASEPSNDKLPKRVASLLYIKGSGEYQTRSELLFSFIKSAIGAKVADRRILGALLDSKFSGCGIFEHVQDNGGRPYAKRQLEQAHDKSSQERASSGKDYEAVWASDVVIRPLQWVWRGHLMVGAQELLTGVPGLGKSQVQCSFAACVTTGRDWPDGTRGDDPANVIMVTAEDALDQVVVPRLMAAGADINRIKFLTAIKHDGKRRWFLLGEDIDALEKMIKETGNVALVEIDPITAFMGKINSNMVTDVRGQLGLLKDLAERTQVAFSTITHPPKSGGQQAIDHFIGSQAFVAAARIAHLCLPEMTIDASGTPEPTERILFTTAMSNHLKMPTLAYRIEQTVVGTDRVTRTEAVHVVWEESVDLSADQAIAAVKGSARTTPVDIFVRELMASNKGEMSAIDVEEAGKEKGFSKAKLWGAKKRLGIKSERDGIHGWKWHMKTTDSEKDD